MEKFKKGLRALAFVCLLVLAVLGVPFGALTFEIRRREDPEKQKTELSEERKQQKGGLMG